MVVKHILDNGVTVLIDEMTDVRSFSLGFFVALYLALGVVDFVLMRRYARPDRPPTRDELPQPAVTF